MSLLSQFKRNQNGKNTQIVNIDEKLEFIYIIDDIITDETVKQMKNFRQHCDTSCYEHCLHVAYYSYFLCKKLGLDYISAARAAMLHDFFLYDWRKNRRNVELSELHAFAHPKIALKNASSIFSLNEKEEDIIVKHMWPVTPAFPKYKEAYIVTLMDKYSAIKEVLLYMQLKLRKNRIYKYAYIFSSLILFRIV